MAKIFISWTILHGLKNILLKAGQQITNAPKPTKQYFAFLLVKFGVSVLWWQKPVPAVLFKIQ